MKIQLGWCLAAVVLCAGVCGCGSGRAKVTGRLTYKGEPVPSTRVVFQPDDGSRGSIGRTDDNGCFSLSYSRQENRIPRGPYTVTLKYAPSAEEETHQIPPKLSRELREVIAQHGDQSTSNLRFEIKRSKQDIEIKLE